MGFSMELVKAKRRIKELEAQLATITFPAPPESAASITANDVFNLLLPYGINISGSTGDWEYLLMSKEEANRFMAWYKENAPIKPGDYTPDDMDCDKFAWIMRAWALLWSKCKYLWGYVEAESIDPDYPFPNHGFDFVILSDRTVWFADQLEVAGPDDAIIEAYPVKSYAAKC